MSRKTGCRFRPDIGFLLEALKFKANGGDMSMYPKIYPGDIVEILDLYGEGKEPWKVFSGINEISELHDVDDWQQKSRVKYIVTKLSKIGPRNYCRAAGAGSWEGQGTKSVEFKGQEIFEMATLTYGFRGDPSDAEGKPHYWMHEYHLSQQSLGEIGLSSSDYVICRVMKDLSKRCHIKKGRKRASSSTVTLPKKKVKKNAIPPQEHNRESNAVPMNQGYVEGCSLSLGIDEQFTTLDDFPDGLFDNCSAPGATSLSGEKKAFLETLDCVEIFGPGCVIGEHPNCCEIHDGFEGETVAACSSDMLTLDDFPDSLFGNVGNEDEEEVLKYFSYEFLKSAGLIDILT